MPSRPFRTAVLAALLAGCTREPTSANRPASSRTATTAPAKVAGPTPPPSAATLVERGKRAAESGDLTAAVLFLSQAVRAEPTNRVALRLLALTAQRQAEILSRPQNSPFYLASGEAVRKLRNAYPDLTEEEKRMLPALLYNEACTLSLHGESARAIGVLAESMDAGFDRIELIEADPELDPIRDLPGFRNLQDRLERRHATAVLALQKPFPFDFRLPDPDGKAVALADFRGKVTVVVFWATWCSPARKEVTHLAELSRRSRKKDLAVVGISDEAEEGDKARKAVAAFVKENVITFPCLIGDEATRDKVPGFGGYPTTLFLDREGKVRLRLTGYQSPPAIEAVVDALLDPGKGRTVPR